jgi:hypothetical protein
MIAVREVAWGCRHQYPEDQAGDYHGDRLVHSSREETSQLYGGEATITLIASPHDSHEPGCGRTTRVSVRLPHHRHRYHHRFGRRSKYYVVRSRGEMTDVRSMTVYPGAHLAVGVDIQLPAKYVP